MSPDLAWGFSGEGEFNRKGEGIFFIFLFLFAYQKSFSHLVLTPWPGKLSCRDDHGFNLMGP